MFFRKKSLRELIEEERLNGLQDHQILVRVYFDGGETVYYKVSVSV